MTLGDPVCTRCACRFTSCACVDDRIASEMQDIKGPSEMVRLVPEGRAERQVAAVREVLALLDERVEILRRPGDPSLAAYFEGRAAGEMAGTQQAADAIRRALETANTAEAGGDEG